MATTVHAPEGQVCVPHGAIAVQGSLRAESQRAETLEEGLQQEEAHSAELQVRGRLLAPVAARACTWRAESQP